MNTKTENINDTRKKITVAFDAAETAQEAEKVLADFVRNANVHGFRQGKAPKAMIEKIYGNSIKEQTRQSLVNKAVKSLNDIKDIDIFAVVDLKQDEKDGASTVEFTVDVYPEVKLPESLATKVELESAQATEKEIDAAVEYHRNQRAKYEPVDREIKKGDFVRLSYVGTVDGKSVSEIAPDQHLYADQKSTWEEAGNAEAPGIQGIVQGILGMKKGEKKTVEHVFPKEFPNKDLAGKTAKYDVEILEIREKQLPALDAEFFKAFEADSLEALRAKMKAAIESEKKNNNEILKRQFAVEQLMKDVKFPLPESAVEEERNAILEDMMMRFMSSGASRDDIEKNKDSLVSEATKEAEGRAKMRIFLNRVARANELKVDNDDMSRMLWQEAMRTRTKPEELIKKMRKDSSIVNRLRGDALLQKAINFIAEKAEVSEKAPAKA